MQNPIYYMQHALNLANSGLGRVYPNPSVGCVFVKDGIVVGVGCTAIGGRPHGEAVALSIAGADSHGATVYVTLEPCAHSCQTPSCSDSLIKAGIKKCYIATLDPDPRTNGLGAKKLTDAGIEVITGLLEDQAISVNKGFFSKIIKNRPLFCAKIAMSADGKIALSNNESKWITGDSARRYGHYLRASFDAIIVGAATVRADNPSLSCRLNGCENQSPVRIVLGKNIPQDSKILTDGNPTHVLDGDVQDIAQQLAKMGFTRVLIEGGATTITNFMNAGLIDELALFSAPKIMGADSKNSIGNLGLLDMQNVAQYKRLKTKKLGDDIYTLLTKD